VRSRTSEIAGRGLAKERLLALKSLTNCRADSLAGKCILNGRGRLAFTPPYLNNFRFGGKDSATGRMISVRSFVSSATLSAGLAEEDSGTPRTTVLNEHFLRSDSSSKIWGIQSASGNSDFPT